MARRKEGGLQDTMPSGADHGFRWANAASFWHPDYMVSSSWHGHAPFASWIVSVLKPRSIVELGTAGGFSYFTFCQAVKSLGIDARCYAIDTWKGDVHSGFFGEWVFEQVEHYNRDRYSEFSSLIRSTFDDALTHFSSGSVDLLHIDGRHFYEDAKHDFESWRPKLSDRAVVLFHDTNVRERGFGVFRLWEEISPKFPSFEFLHCHGLGVLGVGSALPETVRAFFKAMADPAAASEMRQVYGALGGAIENEFSLKVRAGGPAVDAERQSAAARDMQQRLAEQEKELEGLSAELAGQVARLNQLERTLAECELIVRELRNSTSWRITAPLRALPQGLRWLKRTLTH